MCNLNELLRDHVTLDIECLDRLYLNGYVPTLQVGGQLVQFLHHRGWKIPSPAILGQMTQDYTAAVKAYAAAHQVPLVKFEHGVRKDDVVATYREQFDSAEGVVLIGVAQEKAYAFKGTKKRQDGPVGFDYTRQSVYVNHYYFYLQDTDFGPGFIKVCSYMPYPVKVCLNGHEWVKQQLRRAGVTFEALDNGFASCADATRLQVLCDHLGSEHIQAFFDNWRCRLPWPLNEADAQAGYDHRLSIWQVEVCRTQVFDDPVRGREFFETVIRDNLDAGRPDRVQLLFDRKIIQSTPGKFRTRVIEDGVHPSLHLDYKRCHVKQYFKEGRALRTETTINDPRDFGSNKALRNLPFLQNIGRQVNRRLLDVQRLSHDCGLSAESVERLVRPTDTGDGQCAPGMRLGDLRVMALLAALTLFSHQINGFRHADMRNQMAGLLGVIMAEYTASQMTYDLRRLRLKGLIWRVPHSHRYRVTSYGINVALFLTRVNARLFRPGFAALQPEQPLPSPLAQAFQRVNAEIDRLTENAYLKKAV